MSIDIDINIFPCDKLIETIEFLKDRDIECNIVGARKLIEDERTNEVQYLLNEKCITIDEFLSVYDFDDDPNEIRFLIKIKLTRVCAGRVLVDIIEENNIHYLKSMIETFSEIRNAINYNEGQPLITACKLSNYNIVEYLTSIGADTNICAYDPIIDTLLNDNVELTKYLIMHGSNLRNLKSKNIETIFGDNCLISINFIIEQLENNQLEHLKHMDWLECLRSTVEYGNVEVLIKLVRNGINIKTNYYELKSYARNNKMMRFYLRIIRRANRKSTGNLVLNL